MIKKISELTEMTDIKDTDIFPMVDMTNGETKKAAFNKLLNVIIPKNAGAHNGIYRGKDITDLFYDGTLSKQIAAGTFDDIYIGDYIIGKVSGRKYIVADINYRLNCGDTQCTKPHVLMIPDRNIGTAQMNSTNITTGAYTGSEMYTTHLATYKNIIRNDFETGHILTHRSYLPNAVSNGYESGGAWVDSDIELMNELMVYGSNIFHNVTNGTNIPTNYTIDKSQLSLFKLDKSKIVALNDAGGRESWWLRDVVSSASFAFVTHLGYVNYTGSSYSFGVRPAFLIY